ncbi:hypothetical protein [Microbacterium sp. ZW T5_56]|uniref:hypothetical protein n=1 Tax=Microbacterium sp. ZW T5_56 TaxID=3378081 RepID=UPI003854BE6A
MGFSLHFMPVERDRLVEPDRAGLAAFLDTAGLAVHADGSGLYRTSDESALSFDGSWTDLTLDPLDQDEPVTGSLAHATLTADECSFVFGLCRAGRLMIINAQGSPMYVGIVGVHDPAVFPDAEDAVLIDSAEELASALGRGFADFQEYRDRVLRSSEDNA